MAERKERQDLMEVGVIKGLNICQTQDAKWLCLDEMYQKFHRAHFYDIGGTCNADVPDYWFLCKTEQVGSIFLLHLFIHNRYKASFNISLPYSSDITIDKKNSKVYLSALSKNYQFRDVAELTETYLTTYQFTDLDIEMMRDKKLYISAKFIKGELNRCSQMLIEDILISHNFGALLQDPVGSDFIIESMDGKKFKVHKLLLTTYSEVFKAMLKEDTAESQNNFVKLIDVSKEDLECILEFIYTGTVKNIQNINCCNLLMLADKYDINGLRELSEYVLSKQITTENVLEVLVVSDLANSDSLKITALKFIKKNPSVVKCSSFKEITNISLVQELCQYLIPT